MMSDSLRLLQGHPLLWAPLAAAVALLLLGAVEGIRGLMRKPKQEPRPPEDGATAPRTLYAMLGLNALAPVAITFFVGHAVLQSFGELAAAPWPEARESILVSGALLLLLVPVVTGTVVLILASLWSIWRAGRFKGLLGASIGGVLLGTSLLWTSYYAWSALGAARDVLMIADPFAFTRYASMIASDPDTASLPPWLIFLCGALGFGALAAGAGWGFVIAP